MIGRGAAPWVILALAVAGAADAQAPTAAKRPRPPNQTAIRAEVESPGRVVVTRLSHLDPIALSGDGALRVSAIGVFEPGQEHQRILGLRLDLEAPGLNPAQGRHYLDIHEVEGLLKAIFLLEQLAAEAREDFESEADYRTVEGFVIGVNVQDGEVAFWLEAGRVRGARGRVGLPRSQLTTLRQRLELARTRLFTE